MNTFAISFSIAFIFIWCGLIFGISFIESWLKFKAPNVTIPIGLGIGKIVFAVLNKIEWVLFIFISICFLNAIKFISLASVFLITTLAILILMQSFWLLPKLNKRADESINGKSSPPSKVHLYYIFIEIIKFILLLITGILQIKIIN